MAAFSLSDEGLQFLKGKAVVKGQESSEGVDEKLRRLQHDLVMLKTNAVESLQHQGRLKD